ncbi:MAG: phage major capsid protein [Bacteroidales bacterium]|jgi:HK97 family phage major capsid protein|nr:phage major capsid protein [Bacteroidales bacterium]
MSKIKELKEKRASVFAKIDELRSAADGRSMNAEEQQRWDTLLAEYSSVDKEVEAEERYEQIQKRQAEQQYAAQRQNATSAGDDSHHDEEYRAAFADYLINGAQGLKPESRAVIEQRDSASGLSGGVIIPKSLSSEIEIALKAYGGMFEAASIISTSKGGDLILPTINDTSAKATIVAEYNQNTRRAPSFSSVTLKAYTYRTPIIPVSLELLQDSAFNLDSLLSGLLSESFGRGINEHLTTGDGSGKPTGIVGAATACTDTAAASAISLDNIIDLIKSVDSSYARNGRFMFNRNTLYALAKIKDQQGRYIWQQSAQVGQAATLFGKNYVINDDMADIGPENASVLFGDLSKYKIRTVSSFKVVRLNELLAEYLSIGLFGFARADGNLIDAGTHPVKKLVHAAE